MQQFRVYIDTTPPAGNTDGAVSVIDTAVVIPVKDSAGQVLPVAGSGTLEITPSGVATGSIEDFRIKYSAATALKNAYLFVQLPFVQLPGTGLVEPEEGAGITLQKDKSSDPYYLSEASLPGDAKQVFNNTATPNIIIWGPLKGKVSFTRTLRQATVSDDR